MNTEKKIAVLCHYTLQANRIGGMDRFFVAFDANAKTMNLKIDWYFTDYQPFDFYSSMNIQHAAGQNIEDFFLEKTALQNNNYTVLITHFVSLCTSFFKKAKETGIQKIIAVDHNPRPLEGFGFSKIIKNKIKGILYSRYIDVFVAVSKYTKKHILKDYGSFLNSKTIVIYNGIDTAIFVKRTNPNPNTFIVSSHLRHSKGIQDLIMAVSLLNDTIKDQISIDVFGTGPIENELKSMTTSLNLNKIIRFRGSSPDLHLLFCNYSFMIQPTYMECFSLSVLESLACNVPVITTTVGGNLEIVSDLKNGFIFEPTNIKALSSIIENIVLGRLKIDTETFSQIEKNYNINKMVASHLALI